MTESLSPEAGEALAVSLRDSLDERVHEFDSGVVTPTPWSEARDAVVCVVDDDDSLCRALARLFRSAGLQVETFRSAKDFLAYPQPARPTCLVLDVRLPGLSGLDLQEVLSKAGREVPVIFITGHGDVPSSVRAMKGGAVDFLQKPLDEWELLGCVERALARSYEQRAAQAAREEMQARIAILTPREREVLLHLITGQLNKQIAYDLSIAEKTVKVHRGRVMQKMRAQSVADLVRMVQTAGLERPTPDPRSADRAAATLLPGIPEELHGGERRQVQRQRA